MDFQRWSHLRNAENKVPDIAVHEVPAVSLQLVPHLLDEIRRPIEIEFLFPPGQYPQQPVKANEMVDMGV